MAMRSDHPAGGDGRARPRLAVSGLFLANGMMLGAWAPKVPVLMQRLQIDPGTAGLMVLCLGLGSLSVMPVFGALTARRGSTVAVRWATLLALPTLMMTALAPGLPAVFAAVFLFGGFLGGMDVAMNANAVAVERARARAIMSSCHGFWSLGGVLGAAAGGMLLAHLGEIGQALVITAAMTAVVGWALPRLLADGPAGDTPHERLRLPRSPVVYVIGVMALCCMIPEGAILDWSAVYLQRELGAPVAMAGFGFAACAGTMATMRFLGDLLRQRFGAVRTLRISAVVAMAGLAGAGLAPTAALAISGFALAGLGIANLVPIAFSAAGNMPGLPQGVGLSVVTMMGYSGILVAPGTIGWLAQRGGFSVIYVGLAALLVVPLLLSHLAAAADFDDDGTRLPRADGA